MAKENQKYDGNRKKKSLQIQMYLWVQLHNQNVHLWLGIYEGARQFYINNKHVGIENLNLNV